MSSKYPAVSPLRLCLLLAMVLTLSIIGSCGGPEPVEHLVLAKTYIEQNDINSAVIELKNALQKDPDYAEARWLLGSSYLKIGDGFAAWKELGLAESLGYGGSELIAAKLESLLLQGRLDEILAETENLDRSDSASLALLALRGDALFRQGKLAEAEEIYRAVLSEDETSIRARLGLAQVAIRRVDFVQAALELEDAKKINPDDHRIWSLQGELEILRNQPADAETAFREAVRLAGYDLEAQLGLATSLLLQKKYTEALVPIATVEERYPSHPMARYYRAYIAYQEDRIENARDLLLGILKAQPGHLNSLLLISDIYYKEGNFEQCIEYLSRFISLAPNHLPASKLLGYLYLRVGNPAAAIELLEGLVTRYNDAQLFALLGSAYLGSGELEKGSEWLQKAVQLDPESADIRAQFAMGLSASGAGEAAIAELKAVIELDPGFIRGDVMLIQSYLEKKDYAKVLEAAIEMQARHPDSPLPDYFSGMAYLEMEDYNRARSGFEKALSTQPDFKPALSALARLDIIGNNLESAANRYRQILEFAPDDAATLVNLGNLQGQLGNASEMVELYETARRRNPEALLPRMMLGNYYYQRGEAGNMLKVVDEALKLAPDNPGVLFLLSQAQRLNGMLDEAVATLRAIIEKHPDTDVAMLALGTAQFTDGIEGARLAMTTVLTDDPTNYEALIAAINVAITERNFQDARTRLEQFRIAYPESQNILLLEGTIALNEGKLTDAIQAYEQALDKDYSRTTMMALASAYLRNDEGKKAHTLLDEWLKTHPDDTDVRFTIAADLQEYLSEEETLKIYEQILAGDPGNARVLNNLAMFYIDSGNYNKAQEYAEKAYNQNPDRPEIMDTFGWTLIKLGNIQQGLKILTTAQEKMPDHPDIMYHLAAAMYASGEEQQAISLLTRLLENFAAFPSRSEAEKLLSSLQ